MSKLRRKKLVEGIKPEIKTNTKDQEQEQEQEHGSDREHCGPQRCVPDLSEAERLWSHVFQLFCPTSSVPELPPASTACERVMVREWRWCGVDEDVGELPRLLLHSGPVRPEGCDPVQTQPDIDLDRGRLRPQSPPNELLRETQASDACQRHLEEDGKRSLGGLKRPGVKSDLVKGVSEPSECKRVRDVPFRGVGSRSGGGTPGSHGDKNDITRQARPHKAEGEGSESEGRSGSGLECEGGAKTGSSDVGFKFGVRVSGTESSGGRGVSRLDHRDGNRAGTSGGRDGAGLPGSGMDCCPMCLMLFPAGMSQMECDGHLAQCLSEMNEDIVW